MIISVEKYGWEIQKSLFAYTNQDSIYSHTRDNSKMFNISWLVIVPWLNEAWPLKKNSVTFLQLLKPLKLRQNSITVLRILILILKKGLCHFLPTSEVINAKKGLHRFLKNLKGLNSEKGCKTFLRLLKFLILKKHPITFLWDLKFLILKKGCMTFLRLLKFLILEKDSITSFRLLNVSISKNNSITFLWQFKFFKIAILVNVGEQSLILSYFYQQTWPALGAQFHSIRNIFPFWGQILMEWGDWYVFQCEMCVTWP